MGEIDLRQILGSNIRKRVKQLGISQETASEYAAISPSHLAEIINGKKWPSDKVLVRLAEALQSEPYELFLENTNPQSFNLDRWHKMQMDIKEDIDRVLNHNFRSYYRQDTE